MSLFGSVRSYADGYDSESAVGRFTALAVISALAGVLVAGILLPVVGGLGLAAKGSADSFENLPADLKVPPLAQRSRLLAADGSTLATFFYENRVNVPIAQVPPVMRNALIAIEDSRFYQHNGIDVKGTLRALVANSRSGSVSQGGSTLTQQYVKNVLIEAAQTTQGQQAAREKTVSRKIREARYALALEQQLTKDQILERYFNIAYFGSGAYGIGSASQHYFSRSVNQLSLPQAALLAGLVRNPTAYDPIRFGARAKDRRDVVLHRMAQLHYIDATQEAAAVAAPLGLRVSRPANGCDASSAPFFCDFVLSELKSDPALGHTAEERTRLLLRGGLTIRTSLQPKVQIAAQHTVDARVPRTSPYAAVADIIQPGTGRIQAMAVNRSWGGGRGQIRLNLATGGSSGYQAGSTFKIFVLTAAIQQGIPLSLRINSPAHYLSTAFPADRPFPYPVRNAGDSEAGNYDMVGATWESVNTYFIQLEERTGVDAPATIAESMGLRRLPANRPLLRVPSFTLGTNEVSPLSMAGAYATYAAHGNYCRPTGIVLVTDIRGRRYDGGDIKCSQVLDPAIADTVTSVLRGVIDGNHLKTGGLASFGRPAAGKTGTVQNNAGAWFMGYTPELAGAVWVGSPTAPNRYTLNSVTIAGTFYKHVYGGSLPAPIWAAIMRGALAGTPVRDFAAPDPRVSAGRAVAVPDVRGLPLDEALTILRAAGLSPVAATARVFGGQAGLVGRTSPGVGSNVPVGTVVTVYLSNGLVAPPPPKPTPSPTPGKPTPTPTPTKSAKPKPSRTAPPPPPPR